jgi:hypothetical protein
MDDVSKRRHDSPKRYTRRCYVSAAVGKTRALATCVPHTPVVKAKYRYTGFRKITTQVHKLPVTSDTVLGSTHDNHYANI